MAVRIGSNIPALSVQRNLAQASEEFSKSSERLASGQRINRASDDAAGLAVTSQLLNRSKLYAQSFKNINDGLSSLSIIDSSLGSQLDILSRLSELAAQSSNSVYGQPQRNAMQREYSSLVSEFERISQSTEFNGIKVLGTSTAMTTQVGSDGSADSTITISSVTTGTLRGVQGISTDYDGDGDVDGLDLANVTPMTTTGTTPWSTFGALNTFASGAVFLTQVVDSTGQTRDIAVAPAIYAFGSTEPTTNGQVAWGAFVQDTSSVRYVGPGSVTLVTSNSASSLALNFGGGVTGTVNFDFSQITFVGTNSSSSSTRKISQSSNILAMTGVFGPEMARSSLDVLNTIRGDLSNLRSTVGAFQSRLNIAQNLSSIIQTESSNAASRIKDVDVAAETAVAVRSNILQNASASLLAQVNQSPSIALALLAA